MENLPEHLQWIRDNIKHELKLLAQAMVEIMGIQSLVSLENCIESPAILRKLIINEVRIMHSNMKEVLKTFEENVDTCFYSKYEDDKNIVDVEITLSDDDNDKTAHNLNADVKSVNNSPVTISTNEVELNPLFDLQSSGSFKKNEAVDESLKNETSLEMSDGKLQTENTSNVKNSDGSFKLIARFPCLNCPKVFCTHLELRRHNKEKHNFDGVCCPVCKKKMKYPREVDEHIRCFHTDKRPYQCSICGKSFSRTTSFKVHQRVHSTARPFVCDICGKSFRSRQDVQSHKVLHIGKKTYICSICGKSFVRSHNLTQHMKTHYKSEKNRKKK